MSQAKVTEFFSTRKRNRFNQDEILLNKQRKEQVIIEAPELTAKQMEQLKSLKEKILANQERTLRSRTKHKQVEEEPPSAPAPIPPPSDKKVVKQNEVKEAAPVPSKVSEPAAKPNKTTRGKRVNMAELKQKIEQFNQNLLAIQSEAKTQEAEPEVKSKPVETEEPNLPAYLKFKDLASKDIDVTTTLTLPKTYQILFDSFKGSDSIVKMLFNRSEICTFLKLKMGIQNITKHTFTLKHLGQIKTVYSEAYNYKQEKMFIDFKNDYHLIIEPNLDEIELNKENGQREFSPAVLLKRLNKFKFNLFDVVRKLHQAFLESIGIKDMSLDNIKRWHPKFDLESVKDIDESELPRPPVDDSIKCKSGQELLNIAKDIYSARIQNAIKANEAEKSKTDEALSAAKIEKPTQDVPTSNPTEKKSTAYNSLLEKIRNKEKQKELAKMVINSDSDKNITKFSNIKDAIRFMMFFFPSEKKSTLELDKVCQKMADNLKGKLNDFECNELVKSIAATGEHEQLFSNEAGKKWLNIIKVRNVFYLQMDKSFQLNDLYAVCDKQIEAFKSS